jgi:iron complex transport system substrate-binding protein
MQWRLIILLFLLAAFSSCKKDNNLTIKTAKVSNEIKYAKGFSLQKYDGFSILKVINPWPKAEKSYTYILKQKAVQIPDSLQQFTIVNVPIQSIIVTSTTHIPSLDMLGVENSLVGFPNLNYISSEKVRARIDAGKVKELGRNNDLNTEQIIELAPSVIIGYGIDNNNPTLENLQKSGLKILFNGDWNEQTPLGKAEWIKFFGALYGLDQEAKSIFDKIAEDYNNTKLLAKNVKNRPTVMSGAMFGDQWFLPKGDSWGSYFLKDAKANYLWGNTAGTGSLSLSFETVLEKAQHATFWIGPGQFTTLKEIATSNSHYIQFEAFRTKNVYSFSSKKGKTGGVLYYELAPNRPDLVLKDILKIVHPELLPNHELYFFEKLK